MIWPCRMARTAPVLHMRRRIDTPEDEAPLLKITA